MSKTYHGYREYLIGSDGTPVTLRCHVHVSDKHERYCLQPRNDLRNHSPDGFEWGYGGSGPAQLALALVADACGSKYAVAKIYQRVKVKLVAKLPKDGWTVTADTVAGMVAELVENMGITEEDLAT